MADGIDDIDVIDDDPLEDVTDDETDDEVEGEGDVDGEAETIVEEEPITALPNIKIKVIDPEDRILSNMLNLYEFAAIVGIRAKHIENGDDYFADCKGCDTAIEIAEKEIALGRCPMIVERRAYRVDDTIYVEHWKLSELILDLTILS